MGCKILLVEDSPTDAAIMLAAFESIGYADNIRVAQNGIEAIDFLCGIDEGGEWPSLILLDLNLPKRNGLEVLEEIKTNARWRSIPTVVFSSSSSANDVSNSYWHHANAYIAKPRELSQYELVAQQLHSFWLKSAELPE
ncbi:MAG: response regulator [Cyanobacteria bacterium P01_F01_bin.3]